MTLDPKSPEYRRLCLGLLRVMVQSLRTASQRANGEWGVEPEDALFTPERSRKRLRRSSSCRVTSSPITSRKQASSSGSCSSMARLNRNTGSAPRLRAKAGIFSRGTCMRPLLIIEITFWFLQPNSSAIWRWLLGIAGIKSAMSVWNEEPPAWMSSPWLFPFPLQQLGMKVADRERIPGAERVARRMMPNSGGSLRQFRYRFWRSLY